MKPKIRTRPHRWEWIQRFRRSWISSRLKRKTKKLIKAEKTLRWMETAVDTQRAAIKVQMMHLNDLQGLMQEMQESQEFRVRGILTGPSPTPALLEKELLDEVL